MSNYKDHSHSWKPNGSSASEEIPRLFFRIRRHIAVSLMRGPGQHIVLQQTPSHSVLFPTCMIVMALRARIMRSFGFEPLFQTPSGKQEYTFTWRNISLLMGLLSLFSFVQEPVYRWLMLTWNLIHTLSMNVGQYFSLIPSLKLMFTKKVTISRTNNRYMCLYSVT